MTTLPKFVLTLYFATHTEETDQHIQELQAGLRALFPEGNWILNMVDVLSTPEKAIANDIFATPTLVRELPEPVIKVLDGLTKIPQVLTIITRITHQHTTLVL